MRRYRGVLVLLVWAIAGGVFWLSHHLVPRTRMPVNLSLPKNPTATVFHNGVLFAIDEGRKKVDVYDLVRGRRLASSNRSPWFMTSHTVTRISDDRILALSVEPTTRNLIVLNLVDDRVVATFPVDTDQIRQVLLSPNGRLVAVHIPQEGRIRIGSVDTNEWAMEFPNVGSDQQATLCFSLESRRLAVYNPGQPMNVFDLSTQTRAVFPLPTEPLKFLSIRPRFLADGRLITEADSSTSGRQLWDITNNRRLPSRSFPSEWLGDDSSYYLHRVNALDSVARWAVSIGASPSQFARILDYGRRVCIIETTTGREVAQFPDLGPRWMMTYDAAAEALSVYSTADATITVWDIPPRRAAPRWALWLSLVAALAATRWWRARRRQHTSQPVEGTP